MSRDLDHIRANPRFDCPRCHKQVTHGEGMTEQQGRSQHFRMIHALPSREAVANARADNAWWDNLWPEHKRAIRQPEHES